MMPQWLEVTITIVCLVVLFVSHQHSISLLRRHRKKIFGEKDDLKSTNLVLMVTVPKDATPSETREYVRRSRWVFADLIAVWIGTLTVMNVIGS